MPEPIQTLDFSILDWIQSCIRNDALDWIVPKITMLGDKGILWIFIALLCIAVRKWRKCGITMASALLAGLLIGNVLLKLTVARERPCWIAPPDLMLIPIPKDFSFPSCHSLSGFAASLSLLYYHKHTGMAALLLAITIALTRLYLYVHFPSDVLAGILLGTGIAAATIFMTNRYLWDPMQKRFPNLLPNE